MITDDRTLTAAAREASRRSGFAVREDGVHRHSERIVAARYRLDNGLTILFAPDARANVFSYQSWFEVGSKHEHPERTGLAHLLEHLMFKATKHHPAGELDREMERRGTQTNAATWVDWTYYHEALAARADNLETVVAYEVDRMQHLLLDAATFASELEVVKNERRMSVDDSIGGTLSERLYAKAFTTHPYRWPTIGSMAHLQATTLADLSAFYRTYYAPNNAIVVVGGDLEPAATLTLLAERYGPVAAQPLVKAALPIEPRQEQARLEVIERPVLAPQLCVAYHTPAQKDPDFAAAHLLGEALVEGDNARLYKRLVTDERLATTVDGALMPFADPGLYEVFVTARKGVDPERIIAVLQEELDRLVAGGLRQEELDKARNGLELGYFEGMKNVLGITDSLGHHEANYGDFTLAFTAHERLMRVSAADLSRVAAEVFRAGNRTSVVAVPGESRG